MPPAWASPSLGSCRPKQQKRKSCGPSHLHRSYVVKQIQIRTAEASDRIIISYTSMQHDSLAEWSKALASGASPQGRGLEPHSCHVCSLLHLGPATQRLATLPPSKRSRCFPTPVATGLSIGAIGAQLMKSAGALPAPKLPSHQSEEAQWLACWAHNPKLRGSKPRFARVVGASRPHDHWAAWLSPWGS